MNDTATAIRITPRDFSDLSVTSDTGPGAIEIRNLDFFYGKGHALKGVNMSVPAKCVTAIIPESSFFRQEQPAGQRQSCMTSTTSSSAIRFRVRLFAR